MRLGIRTILQAQVDMQLVVEAETFEAGMRIAEHQDLDVVILPLRLEGKTVGLELCRSIKSMERPPRVLMYTAFSSPREALLAYLFGADSLLSKNTPMEYLLAAIQSTAKNQEIWEPDPFTRSQTDELRETLESADLTNREEEILSLLLMRHTNLSIADALQIEVSTVKTHVSRILRKMGFETREGLLRNEEMR